MEAVRITAKTLDDAITKACVELGATSEMIVYEVIETGSNGILGIGARPYVIEARKRGDEEPAAEQKKSFAADKNHTRQAEEIGKAPAPVKAENSEKAVEKAELHNTQSSDESREKAEPSEVPQPAARTEEHPREERILKLSEEEKQGAIHQAEEFLHSVFEGMELAVEITSEFDERGDLLIDLSGEEMGVLIGKRGQTLDALQYLTSQVINKHRGEYIRVRLDTENYRERRRETLENLAYNISYKVRRSRRSVALEPMNPYERRIIHSVLQNERDVATRSEGEEPYRHVVVYCTKRRR